MPVFGNNPLFTEVFIDQPGISCKKEVRSEWKSEVEAAWTLTGGTEVKKRRDSMFHSVLL